MMLLLRGIDDEGMPINRFIYVDRDKVLEVADHIAVSGWRYARLEYDGSRVGELVYSVAQKRSIWIWGSTQTANLPAQNQFRQSIVRRLRAGLESASTRGRTLTRTEQATPGAAGLQEDTVAEAGEGKTRPMVIKESVHGRSGSEPPARFNAACWPEMMWTSYATTVILSNNPVEITCRQCRFVLDLSEAGDSDAQDS